MKHYPELLRELRRNPKRWLVTGAAGFIGSHLVEELLKLDQNVIGLDNYSTGHRKNLQDVQEAVTPERWNRFGLVEGDIRDIELCASATAEVDCILHQAAMASVPHSIAQPELCHEVNVTGFVNLLRAAKTGGVQRIIYASSCAVYGDDPDLPKTEKSQLRCLSPYALSKLMDEQYAEIWGRCYDCETIGLRYFNIFGPRQDPNGAYAAVIPKWIAALKQDQGVVIHGDGKTTRDFCYVANVVQANLLAATATLPDVVNQVYNIGAGGQTSLNELFEALQRDIAESCPKLKLREPLYDDFRGGDIRHSEASIAKAENLLGYKPCLGFGEGLANTVAWCLANSDRR